MVNTIVIVPVIVQIEHRLVPAQVRRLADPPVRPLRTMRQKRGEKYLNICATNCHKIQKVRIYHHLAHSTIRRGIHVQENGYKIW